MRTTWAGVCVIATLVWACSAAPAACATIWTDANGDGLPDTTIFNVPANTIDTVDIWIDSESFAWTNYLVYVEHASGAFKRRYAGYSIQGGNFPIDWFSLPRGVGFGGYGYDNQGVEKIGWFAFKFLGTTALNGKCIKPIIDIYNSYGVFSQLGSSESYALFSTASNSCYKSASGGGAKTDGTGDVADEGVEDTSWGRVKGLYR